MAGLSFVPSGDAAKDKLVRRQYARGKLQRLMEGVYVDPGQEPIETFVLRNWHRLAANVVPEGVVTDRTGIDAQPWRDRATGSPSGDGFVFMSAPRSRSTFAFPGLMISVRSGAGPAAGDLPFLDTRIASPARQLLDNMTPSRARSGPSRTVGAAGVEAKLESICALHGAERLNTLRDDARALAPSIDRGEEFALLDKLIGTLLGTNDIKLKTIQGKARSQGRPIDIACVERLHRLREFLIVHNASGTPNAETNGEFLAAGAFVESYFSNYIEGTRFTVEEATEIVFEGKTPNNRPEDGHDVLAAYLQLVELEPRCPPIDPHTFISEVKERHRLLMKGRTAVNPGQFKDKQNQAGDTVFSSPEMVEGTMLEGLKLFSSLQKPFARAMFVHYMLSDVHPFTDGNGRIARIMMTKELAASGLSRIVVPTIFRDDYIDGLRVISRRSEPSIFVRSMQYCQAISAACATNSVQGAIRKWASAYAFCEDVRRARLSMPNPSLVLVERNGLLAPADYWD